MATYQRGVSKLLAIPTRRAKRTFTIDSVLAVVPAILKECEVKG
ncbi:hypothetical protein MHB65_10990 [Lysinibacillus sp. FSL K6-0075]